MIVTLAEAAGTATVIGAVLGVDTWLRSRHLNRQDVKLEQIHVLVNSRLTEALERIESLEEALHLATGIPKTMIQENPEAGSTDTGG